MAKKTSKDPVVELMTQIQAQLATLDRKLDAFMTKSLSELAQAKAAHIPKPVATSAPAPQSVRPPENRPARQMYAVVCFDCGKDTEIPFKPSGDRPVYCKECFAKRRAGSTTKPGESKPLMASSYEPMPTVLPPKPAEPPQAPAKPKKKTAPAKTSSAKKKVIKKKGKK